MLRMMMVMKMVCAKWYSSDDQAPKSLGISVTKAQKPKACVHQALNSKPLKDSLPIEPNTS